MSTIFRQTRGKRGNAAPAGRGVPLYFYTWRYTDWNKTQLLYCIRALGGDDQDLTDSTKPILFQRLCQLRPAATSLSEQEIIEVNRWRREGKISNRSTVQNATINFPTLVQRRRNVTENVSESANTQVSTSTQTQKAKECEICADTITLDHTLTRAITQECTHPAQVAICKPCIEHHIHAQIDSVGWDGVRCPVPECRGVFKYNDLQDMASTADFERYDAHIFQKAMEKESGSDYRQCAHPNCTGGGWCSPETESFLTCPKCTQQTCIECNVIWHKGKTCAEHNEDIRNQNENEDAELIKEAADRAATEAKSVEFIEAEYKACPNKNCGYRIEKNGGCDHMTCRKCRHQFCWICDADYMEISRHGNHAHKENCMYHSEQLSQEVRTRPRPIMPLRRRRAARDSR